MPQVRPLKKERERERNRGIKVGKERRGSERERKQLDIQKTEMKQRL